MLSLESPRWGELKHAYGTAENVPALLRQLRSLPPSAGESEPWFTLWSALAHQGDIYSASFAAVPHVVEALASAPAQADASYFQFPAWVEICRARTQPEIPEDLREPYFAALERLPGLVAAVVERPLEPDLLVCALAALAAAKGQPALAEVVLEMSAPGLAEETLEWLADR